MIDHDLELEVALALANLYDACPDPDCRCVDTLRGLDRAGCPRHDEEAPCEPTRLCNFEGTNNEPCCQHGGMCHVREHQHFDADEYVEWQIEGWQEGLAERGRFR